MAPSSRSRLAWSALVVVLACSTLQAERLPLKHYTVAEGLASSVVLDIFADSRGFLWFATRDGLSRFDGSEFRSYTTDDGLPNPVVNRVLQTRKGEYWVATNGGGVCRLNAEGRRAPRAATPAHPEGPARDDSAPALFTCRTVGTDFLSNRVNVLMEDRHDRIWLGTDNGLFRIVGHGDSWQVEPVAVEWRAPRATRALHEDSQGRLWVGITAGLLRLDPDGRVSFYAVRGVAPHDIADIVEHEGGLWIALGLGLLRFLPDRTPPATREQPQDLVPVSGCVERDRGGRASWRDADLCLVSGNDGLLSQPTTALRRAANGRLWIGTRSGLAYLDGMRFVTLPATQLVEANVSVLTDDSAGQLWIGTYAGAFRLTLNGLVSYGADDGLGHPRVRQLFEHPPDGPVFAVSGAWVINRFAESRFHATTARVPAGANFTYYSHGLFVDRGGQGWLLTDRGLARLRPNATLEAAARQPPAKVYTTREGLPADRTDRLFEDSRGDIWIGTRSSKPTNLSRWDRQTDRIRVFREGFGDGYQFPLAFAEDREGAVWIGFESGGLARYVDGRFRLFGAADGVPANLMALHVDAGGALWIASSSAGLSVLRDVGSDRLRLERYTTAQGLASNNIQCLTDDRWGRLYLGTSRGVDRLDPATGRVRHFGTVQGLASDYVTVALRDRTGALWFGTNYGVSRFVPELEPPAPAPLVWIGEVRAGGTLQRVSELGAAAVSELALAPAQNHVQISYFGIALGAGGPLRYRYRLDGTGGEWSDPVEHRVVHYASLAPGRYRFDVEAINADGVASRQAASVSFTVQPPVWRRAWFLALATAALAAMALALHRVRVARILAVERVRARIAADLHDDIGGSLSRIAIQSEVARRDLPGPADASARRLVEIGDTARSVVESLADVVWSVDPVQDDLASVERRVREYAADSLGPRGVRWTFHGTGHLDRFALGPEARRDLLLLLKEGITNIARHAEARVASLHLRVVDGALHAALRDDGRGFDPAGLAHAGEMQGHGIANMRMRAAQLQGSITVESSAGRGTHVTLVVPLRARKRMNMRLWARRPPDEDWPRRDDTRD